jgi:cobalamin biosynthesis protein CobD/CbiB
MVVPRRLAVVAVLMFVGVAMVVVVVVIVVGVLVLMGRFALMRFRRGGMVVAIVICMTGGQRRLAQESSQFRQPIIAAGHARDDRQQH